MDDYTEIYLEFTDAGDLIRLEPISFTLPDADSAWDRSWIKTNVIVKAGVFSGQFVAEFMTTDFEQLKQQLEILDNDFKGTAIFNPLEQQLLLKIKGDGLGHFEIDCEAAPERFLGQTLSFSINFDQTEIKNHIRQLEIITKQFPVSGDLET